MSRLLKPAPGSMTFEQRGYIYYLASIVDGTTANVEEYFSRPGYDTYERAERYIMDTEDGIMRELEGGEYQYLQSRVNGSADIIRKLKRVA